MMEEFVVNICESHTIALQIHENCFVHNSQFEHTADTYCSASQLHFYLIDLIIFIDAVEVIGF